MNTTPRMKNKCKKQSLLLKVNIQFQQLCPTSYRSQQTSLPISPNKIKGRYKLSIPQNDKKIINPSHQISYRDPVITSTNQSRKRVTAPTSNSLHRPQSKYNNNDLSPSNRTISRKNKQQSKIVRNISILDQFVNAEDNIIKYTSNSQQLKSNEQILTQDPKQKILTHISDVDLVDMRDIELKFRKKNQIQYSLKLNDILKIACAKKIQRAWRNYRTKKLIKSYSLDICKKYSKIQQPINSARSQGNGLKIKLNIQKTNKYQDQKIHSYTQRIADKQSKINFKKFQQQSIQTWEYMIQKIKNQQNIDKILQLSLKRSQQLKKQINQQVFFDKDIKKIKTKGYYEEQRQKRRQSIERSAGSIRREQKLNKFQQQILKIQNLDISIDSNSVNGDNLQERQNQKLKKKLDMIKQKIYPQIKPFKIQQKQKNTLKSQTKRIDLSLIIKQKQENNTQKQQKHFQIKKQQNERILSQISQKYISQSSQQNQQQNNLQDNKLYKNNTLFCELFPIQTHRQSIIKLNQIQMTKIQKWKQLLNQKLKINQDQFKQLLLQQLILQMLIQIQQFQYPVKINKLIKKKIKPQGIVTNHTSIRDYLSYFVNFLYEQNFTSKVLQNLKKPVGPSALQTLKYFRGQQLDVDTNNDFIMSINLFNQHWRCANQMIYFDPKYPDNQEKQNQRIANLKQLTKTFFRAIFDCFNQSLQIHRVYGQCGKPYPWNLEYLNIKTPILKDVISKSFQRVMSCASIFCGVLFEDKYHYMDQRQMNDLKQQNLIQGILLELNEQEQLWSFIEDQKVQILLKISQYIQQALLSNQIKDIFSKL